MNGENLSPIIETIYDAAASHDCWPDTLSRLGTAFRSNRCALVERNLETMHGSAIGMDPPSRDEYFSVWKERNIYNTRTPIWRAGEIVTGPQIVPISELLRSDYYNDFLRPRDSFHLLRISLRIEDHVHQSISLTRPRSAEAFQRSDIERASLLLPHLQRAALITCRLQELGMTLGAVEKLLDDNPTGIILLSRTGTVISVNRAGRQMAGLADGFLLRGGCIEALRQSDDALLQRLIKGATSRSDDADPARGGPFRLPRRSGLRDYVVLVAPLYPASQALEQRGAVACILISDPEVTPKRQRSMLRQIYGMTEGEAHIAERLIAGDSPEQAAAALGIKVSTARVHLAALFRKTGTHRQAELV